LLEADRAADIPLGLNNLVLAVSGGLSICIVAQSDRYVRVWMKDSSAMQQRLDSDMGAAFRLAKAMTVVAFLKPAHELKRLKF
jgi:hypothetical protein